MRAFAWICIGLLGFAGLSQAQNELGDVIVVTGAEGGQQFPDVVYNSQDNTFLVVWEELITGETNDIMGVLLNGDTGQPVGSVIEYFVGGDGHQAPELAYNSKANEFALIARHRTSQVVWLQRISANGQPLGDAVEIGPSAGPIFDPAARARVASITYNPTDDKYFVALTPGEQPAPLILNPDGSESAAVTPFGRGSNPASAWSSQSNVYLMAWEDRESRNTGAENLSAQVISNAGDPVGDILFVRDQENAEESPRIAYNSDDDQFLVVWDERIGFVGNNTTQTDLVGQIVNVQGEAVGQPIMVEFTNAYTLRQDVDYSPALDKYLVVWKGDAGGEWAFAQIYGRWINRDGSLSGDQFLIYDNGNDATDTGDSQQYFDESKLPAVSLNTKTGKFLVVWEEAGIARDPEMRNINARFVGAGATGLGNWELF